MIKRTAVILIIILFSFCFFSCSETNSIIGKWSMPVNYQIKVMEFQYGGIYTVKNSDDVLEEEGTYEISGNTIIITSAYRLEGDRRLNLQEDSDGRLVFKIDGNILTLTTKQGDSLICTLLP